MKSLCTKLHCARDQLRDVRVRVSPAKVFRAKLCILVSVTKYTDATFGDDFNKGFKNVSYALSNVII